MTRTSISRRALIAGVAASLLAPLNVEAAPIRALHSLLSRPKPAAAPAALALLVVATRGVGPSNNVAMGGASDSNYTRFESRLVHRNGPDPIVGFEAAFPSFYEALGTGEADLPNGYTVEFGLEYGGATSMATFGGAASKLVTPTTPHGHVWTDYTPVASQVPSYTDFFGRTGITVASGEIVYQSDKSRTTGGIDQMVRSTSATSQISGTGALTTPAGGNSTLNVAMGPAMIVAYRASGAKSLIFIEDSIGDGTGDTPSADSPGQMGWLTRAAFIGDGNGHCIPYSTYARPGAKALGTVGATGAGKRSALPFHTHAVFELGINDLRIGSADVSVTPANKATVISSLQSSMLSEWAAAKAAGCKVYQTLITPLVRGPKITGITSSGTACTATVTSAADLPTVGMNVTVQGATVAAYNVTGRPVTAVDTANLTFTYTAITAPASSPAVLLSNVPLFTWHDGFVSLQFQRPVDGFEVGGALRDVMNTWIKARVLDGTLDGYIDPGAEDLTNGPSGIYKVVGGAWVLVDGLHPSPIGHAGMAVFAAPQLWAI